MMQHVSEEQLILHYYGEPAGAEVDNHLAVCFECRDQYRKLQQVLNVVDIPVPERDAGYEDRLWNEVAPKLGFRRRISWWGPRKWAAVAVMATLVVAAFVAGRYSPRTEVPQTAATQPQAQQPVRERVLVVALGDHLERSQMMLIELKNSPDKGKFDIASEQ
jgi:predicted anti-sigma-YlaC factor YlaD